MSDDLRTHAQPQHQRIFFFFVLFFHAPLPSTLGPAWRAQTLPDLPILALSARACLVMPLIPAGLPPCPLPIAPCRRCWSSCCRLRCWSAWMGRWERRRRAEACPRPHLRSGTMASQPPWETPQLQVNISRWCQGKPRKAVFLSGDRMSTNNAPQQFPHY